ncbi:iron (metal) dependent repressor, DtxR family [Alkalispirochaeta americana]|uniref:Transcriptional regulator MntR n=1 Tax=Alkalispirochaeta americana TaxID=159291 RepID=A0A1N6WZF7_9SPIO|nr:metal-dependent transcriptional regulator [Alkalispirochaeta americana]SIQ95462.1 iron (metal) dependent repressor, DtxR family [Alkalispirochaeta americana]
MLIEQITESLGRYLLAIYHLAAENKVARSKDIAEVVGVSRPSVTGALQKLEKTGMINYEPYGYVSLTDAGDGLARKLLLKHRATQDFLQLALGLPHERAQEVSAQIEQSLPADVLCRLVQFNNFYRNNPGKRFDWDPGCRHLCEHLYGMHGPGGRCADDDSPGGPAPGSVDNNEAFREPVPVKADSPGRRGDNPLEEPPGSPISPVSRLPNGID